MPQTLLTYLLWPGLLIACLTAYGWGLHAGHPVAAFNLVYLGLLAALYFLERVLPYEPTWSSSDGQTLNDIGHTVLNKGLGQLAASAAAIFGVFHTGPASAASWWPATWPFAWQVVLALMIVEFGLYWAHRIAHHWMFAWRWHAVHHSVTRLSFINTGRFHFLDSIWKTGFALVLGLIAGAPTEVVLWVLPVTAYIGLLTHCNVQVECGPLNWIFNTPQLHRWHHSRNLSEGNSNYGENLLLWDWLFRTRYFPARRPPVNIGCSDKVPTTFGGQLAYPFRVWLRRKVKKVDGGNGGVQSSGNV